jgi:hypothetical protein
MIIDLMIAFKETSALRVSGDSPYKLTEAGDWVLTLDPAFRYRYLWEGSGLKIVGLGFPIFGILIWPLFSEIHPIVSFGFFGCMCLFYFACRRLAKLSIRLLQEVDALKGSHLVISQRGMEICAAIFSDYRVAKGYFSDNLDSKKLPKVGNIYVIPWDQISSFVVEPRWFSTVFQLNVRTLPFPIGLNRILLEPYETELFMQLKARIGERFILKKTL